MADPEKRTGPAGNGTGSNSQMDGGYSSTIRQVFVGCSIATSGGVS